MADAPIGPNFIQAQLIRTDSPIVFRREVRSTVLFNTESLGEGKGWLLGGFKESEGAALDSSVVRLPQQNGLYGVILKPRFEHYHNFLDFGDVPSSADKINPLHFSKYQKSFEGLNGVMPDKDGIIQSIQDGDEEEGSGPSSSDLLNFYSWLPIPPLIKENSSSTSSATPQDPSTPQENGTFENTTDAFNSISNFLAGFGLDFLTGLVTVGNVAGAATGGQDAQNQSDEEAEAEAENIQRSGPKWEYKLLSVPPDEYGTNSSFTLSDSGADVKKLVPFQEQKQGNGTGNIAGGIHWGLEKKIPIPRRVGFYLDLFTPKTFDFQNKKDKDANIEDQFTIANTSYIVIELEEDETLDDHYFIVISTKGNPKFYRVEEEENERGTISKNTILMSEFTAIDGRTLLKGADGFLRLTFLNVQNNIIISNNVDGSIPWVITRQTTNRDRSENQNDPATSDLDGFVNYMSMGGSLKVYGGNISCGVSYNFLNHYKEGAVSTNQLAAVDTGREFISSLTVLDGRIENIPEEALTDDGKLMINTADEATDDNGGAEAQFRGDNFIGEGVGFIKPSELVAVSNVTDSPDGQQTLASTTVTLKCGVLEYEGIDMGYVKTPVLQTLYQKFPKVDENPGIQNVINATILSIEDSWEAEGTHAVNHTGTLRAWLWDDNRNSELANMTGNIFVRLIVNACPEVETNSSQIIFTGMLINPRVTETVGNREVVYEIKDYWQILEDSIVLNSPYFDGAVDEDVIKFWLDEVGFAEQFIQLAGNSTDIFPFSYGFDAPFSKFKDMSTVASVIKETARKYSKFAMFDRRGAFKYRKIPAIFTGFTGGTGNVKRQYAQTHRNTNRNVTPPLGPGDGNGNLTPDTNVEVCYDVKTYQHDTHNVFNQIRLISVDAATRGYIVKADTNFPSVLEPTSHGYLGYYKPFIQTEAAFGSEAAVQKALRFYTRMYRPPYVITWKTFGGDTGVDINDIVTVDGNKVVVQKIHNSMDGATKQWWIEWEGEWLWPPQINNRRL